MRRAVLFLAAGFAMAQSAGVLSVAPIPQFKIKRGETVPIELSAELKSGYHVNSNTPSDEYLIPLKLSWDAGPLEAEEIVYPKPKTEKYAFSEKPLSVFAGDFKIVTRFKVKPNAAPGPAILGGKLRYQACTDKECLAPKSVPVSVAVTVN